MNESAGRLRHGPPATAPRTARHPVARALACAGCVIAAALVLADFPVARLELLTLAILYALVLARWRDAWLVLLPPVLAGFDLAPWSGRWLFSEVDVFVLVTLASASTDRGLRADPGGPRNGARHLLVVATLAAWSVAAVVGMEGAWPPPFDEFAAHQGVHEGLRAFKGLLYAVALLPALSRAFGRGTGRADTLLATGFALSLCVLGLEVAWDRGVFRHLVAWTNVYAFASDLLDVTSSYRTTALFSGMHTGGAYLDAFLLLALPFAMVLASTVRAVPAALLVLASLGAGGYALLGTFTRASYVACALSIVVLGVLWVARATRTDAQFRPQAVRLVAALVLILAVAVFVYRHGGLQALTAASAAIVSGVALRLAISSARVLWPATALMALGFALLAHDGITDSAWHRDAPYGVVLGVSASAGAAVPAGWWLAARLGARLPGATVAAMAFALLLGLVLGIPATSGYRMETRISRVGVDLETREGHWNDVLNVARGDLVGLAVGSGAGSFPRRYFRAHHDGRPYGNFQFGSAGGRSALRLGAGEFNIMQRVPVEPHRRYELRLRARATGAAARLSVKLCHKNVLYSDRYTPDCSQWVGRFEPGSEWREIGHAVDAGGLGRYGVLYWPVTLLLHAGGEGVLEIDQVQLLDADGRDVIANGDFALGSDRWFFVSDFNHLPWHAKNVLLHLFVEQGVVGLLAFLALATVATRRAFRLRHAGAALPVAWLAAAPALATLGMFDTLLDEPRFVLLLYLTLFAVLYRPGGSRSSVRESASR